MHRQQQPAFGLIALFPLFPLLSLFALFAAGLGLAAPAQASGHFKLGIFPYLDAGSLARQHQPLLRQLETASDRPIRMVTAPNFMAFQTRTLAQQYDILLTAPHFARIAERKRGYRWIGVTANRMHALFATRRASAISQLQQLRGKAIALPPPSALIHQMVLEQLEQAGLQPGSDVTIISKRSHNDVLHALLHGDVAAAAFMHTALRSQPEQVRDSLSTLGSWEELPGLALMIHPRVPATVRKRLEQALIEFTDIPIGKRYFAQTGLLGIRPVSPQDLERLDYYLERIDKTRAADPAESPQNPPEPLKKSSSAPLHIHGAASAIEAA